MHADGRTRKSNILLAASELFVTGDEPTRAERQIFSELFRQYIGDTPVPERRQISSLLSRCAFAPHDCVLALSQDEDASVAHRVLAYSPVLSECDLLAAIGRGPHAMRRAISLRHELSPELHSALKRHMRADEGAPDSAGGVDGSEGSATGIMDMAARLDTAATPGAAAENAAAERDPAPDTTDLPGTEIAARAPRGLGAVADFLALDTEGRALAIGDAQARMLAETVAGGYRARPKVDPTLVNCFEQAALAGDRETLRRLLADTLDLSQAAVEHIVADPHGEPLIVCCAALGLPTSRTVSLMLRISPAAHCLDRLRTLSALRANLDTRAARALVADWSGRTARPRHEPLLQDAMRSRRSAIGGQSEREAAHERGNTLDSAGVLVLRDVV